jgi:hemerythrin
MASQKWNDQYSVGIAALDQIHRKLFGAIGEIENAIAQDAPREETNQLLRLLMEASHEHFAEEEMAMRVAQYPSLQPHCENHRRLAEKLEAFIARHDLKERKMNCRSINFLRDWLLYHIQNDDARYGAWFQDRACREAAKKQAA